MLTSSPLFFSKDIFMSQKNDKYLFLNPNVPDWLVVNENAAYILNQCDGINSATDIISQISAGGGADVAIDVQNLLIQAISHSIINFKKENIHDDIESDIRCSIPDNINHRLRIIHLKLTNECNLTCKYCYANSGKSTKILTLEKLNELSLEISHISRSVEYVLSGGEPLLHPSCLDFGENVKASGNQTHLLTNGTLINRKNARRISQLFDLIKISLDGITEKTHSSTRGNNNFKKVVSAIDLLNKSNANFLVAMTLTRDNVFELPAMVNRFGSNLTVQPFFHAGRGRFHHDLSLSGKEYYDALSAVNGVNPMGAIDKVLTRAKKRGIFKCAVGDSEISISDTGDVFPCQMLDDPLFNAGNVFKNSFQNIYHNSIVLKKIRELTVDKIEGCRSCPVRLICGGACRARTFHENGQIDRSGLFCEYEFLAFVNGIFDSTTID